MKGLVPTVIKSFTLLVRYQTMCINIIKSITVALIVGLGANEFPSVPVGCWLSAITTPRCHNTGLN